MPQANEIVKDLREKLEKKAFEIAKQYNTISDHKAAIVVIDNFITDFPGTKYKGEALFYKFDSAYQLAINSIESKKAERIANAKTAYLNLLKANPSSEWKQKADEMFAKIDTDLKQISNK